MEDNEMVQALVTGILESVNASRLPLAVKALALENVSLRVQAAIAQIEIQEAQKDSGHAKEPTEPEQEE